MTNHLAARSSPLLVSRPRLVRYLLLLLALLYYGHATAQTVEHTENKPDQTLKSGARVDPSTFGMGLDIQLGNLPGRAGTALPISLTYSSKVWRMEYVSSHRSQMNRHTQLSPRFAEHSAAGWTTSLAVPRVEYTGRNNYYRYTGEAKGEDLVAGDQTFEPRYFIARINVHLPDGSSHELRRDDEPHLLPDGETPDFSGTFRAVDGSRLRYNDDAKTLYLPDGSRYLLGDPEGMLELQGQPTPPTLFIDRNGNTLTYDHQTRQWTDTLGRALNLPLPLQPVRGDSPYSLAGAGGGHVVYVLRWRNLSEVLTDMGQQLRHKGSHECGSSYTSVAPYLFNSGYPDYVCAPEIFNPVVLAEIVLPTNQSYRFTYNIYGEIDKVYFPTGGYERFTYEEIPSLSFMNGPYRQANRGVTHRWVSASGAGGDEAPWEYGVTTGVFYSPPYTAYTIAPDLTRSERVLRTGSGGSHSPLYGFDDARVGMALEERSYSAPDQNGERQMLRRKLTEWAVTNGGYGATSDARATKEVTLLLDTGGDALAQTTTYQHDADLNVTSTATHDYTAVSQPTAQTGAVGVMPLGTLLRTEETTYLVNDPNVAQQTRDAYRARDLVGLPSSTRVRDGAGTIVSKGEVRYDEAAYAPLTCGADVGWSDPGANVRGLATTTRRWLDTDGVWVETHAQFDGCGSLRKSWDAHNDSALVHGAVSEIEYAPAYHYAYPTLTRSAAPDPDGLHGSAAPLVTHTTYHLGTGRVTSTTDANGQVTNYHYVDDENHPDPAGRLRKVTLPDGGWTKYDYGSTANNLFVRTRAALDATRSIDAYQYFDGLGRPFRSIKWENLETAEPWITADTEYDVMGRVKRVSLPYRAAAGAALFSTDKWSENTYDALGRVLTVTTRPDNAVVTTGYIGEFVTVTDQAGKVRRSRTDALGRLVRVDEPDASGVLGPTSAPAQPTGYTYDALGNLRKVEQGGQLRFFAYDSLGRLVRAKNPEQGSFTPDPAGGDFPALTDAASSTANSVWSVGYKYAAAGNLIKRKDARNITTTFTYDNLNRNKTVDYSDTTPDVSRYYDNPAGGANGMGRAWKSEAQGVSRSAVSAYNALGRPTGYAQQFSSAGAWGVSFAGSVEYDLAGNVTRQVYPSGREAVYAHDATGRLASFSGTLGDGTARVYSSGITYDQTGGMSRERFGTATPLYHKMRYNPRGQLYDIRLGTTGDAENWDRGRLLNHYGSGDFTQWGKSGPDNNGNVLRTHHFIPDAQGGSVVHYQDYVYDELNRLKRVTESTTGSQSAQYVQQYSYDRWGNRTINVEETSDSSPNWSVPEPDFDTSGLAATNRLYAPGDVALPEPQRRMSYDAAGNLIFDTHQATPGDGGAREYDAENRMTMAEFLSGQTQQAVYTYDADGRRVKRKAGAGGEVWQVYGPGGSLLAEYVAGAPPSSPRKEYGYRGGELLITAEAGSRTNAALASNGATASASSSHSANFPASAVINGDRKGAGWGTPAGGWNDSSEHSFPDWLEVTFPSPKTVDEVNVFTLQDAFASPGEPTEQMTFSSYGLTAFEVQAWDGAAWVTVPGGSVSANDKVWRRVTFPAVVTSNIRVRADASADGYSRVTEIEAWGPAGGGSSINWLVTDHLGTPRMEVDSTGSLSGVRRSDYLPFGEVIGAAAGGRTAAQGYGSFEGARMKFTGKERDGETGLDYFLARYYASAQGRFTSPDEFTGGPRELFTFAAKAAANPTFYADLSNPQSLNKYTYCLNNPLRYVDPDGHEVLLTNKRSSDRREAKGRILYNLSPEERKYFTLKRDKARGGATIELTGNVDKALSKPHTKAFEYLVETVRHSKTVRVQIADSGEAKNGATFDVTAAGGGAQLSADQAKSGDPEVYLGRRGGSLPVPLEDGSVEKSPSRSIVAAHELFGHARLEMLGRPNGEAEATTVENEVREGRGLKKRAL